MKRRLGIIGCGQLGQMLGRAARKLGADVCYLKLKESPVVQGLGQLYDETELDAFLANVDFVTIEREAIPEQILKRAAMESRLFPSYPALMRLRHRHFQKGLFDELNLPTSKWVYVESNDQLASAVSAMDCSRIRAKRVLGGYDGGGQWSLNKDLDLPAIPEQAFPLILEEEIAVDTEISVLLARSEQGEIRHYPINHNLMHEGVLAWSFVPADINLQLAEKARQYAERLVTALDYVGVLAMEFFVSNGDLVVNEIAPRVHNTGHWTIEGCICDQFEQHARAVMGLPLLDPKPVSAAGMCNILGNQVPQKLPDEPVRMYLHGYGKAARPGRKMGHITLTGPDKDTLIQAAKDIGLFAPVLSHH